MNYNDYSFLLNNLIFIIFFIITLNLKFNSFLVFHVFHFVFCTEKTAGFYRNFWASNAIYYGSFFVNSIYSVAHLIQCVFVLLIITHYLFHLLSISRRRDTTVVAEKIWFQSQQHLRSSFKLWWLIFSKFFRSSLRFLHTQSKINVFSSFLITYRLFGTPRPY